MPHANERWTAASARESSIANTLLVWIGAGKVKHVVRTERQLEPEMEMDNPTLHSELLYCTIEKNKKCDNESVMRGQPGKMDPVQHLRHLGYRCVRRVPGAVV